MKFPLFSSSSVTRWLIVVVGCAVLETAQLMPAAEPLPATRVGDTVLYPAGGPASATASTPATPAAVSSTWVFVLFVGLAAGAVWVWSRRRTGPAGRRGLIQIEDTRPLGNRQFLVVASCDGRRFLLGVAAGGIQMLSPLDSTEDAAQAK